ncbi:MAG TPA: hypothetical protein VKL99_07195 [Candidatus Angelobacter sp.]|nr:hypothetical protein [Candidatus Angelobacter sp.]
MAPILELIKKNAVPVNVMRSAAKGALPLSADETIEVLVYLTQNPLFGQDARMTLAKWDVSSAIEVLSKDTAPPEVLLYFWQEENRRPSLMPTLIENPAIPENSLIELAAGTPREIVSMLLASPRARATPGVVESLLTNEYLTPAEAQELREGVARNETAQATPPAVSEDSSGQAETAPETEVAHQVFQQEHAAEIAAAEGKPFELTVEEIALAEKVAAVQEEQEVSPAQAAGNEAAMAAVAMSGPVPNSVDELNAAEQKQLTVLQRVSRMNVAQRIRAAFAGGREERALLVRDTARVVQNAVLASPKLTDPEVETFSAAKNLQENVFREIARQRRFLKLYPVVRNLVNNPKCPLDISLTLIKTLMVYDLKSLRHNKNVPDTIRKVAAKLYQEKASRGGAKKE